MCVNGSRTRLAVVESIAIGTVCRGRDPRVCNFRVRGLPPSPVLGLTSQKGQEVVISEHTISKGFKDFPVVKVV